MHDLKKIKENPDAFDLGLVNRGYPKKSSLILSIDLEKRNLQTQLQDLQSKRNNLSKEAGKLKNSGSSDEYNLLIDNLANIKKDIKIYEDKEKDLKSELFKILSEIPNIPSKNVPIGKDENDNVLIREWGKKISANFEFKDHVFIGENLKLMDFENTSKFSGSRFVTLKGDLAKLERALGQFMLDTHINEHGYTEISPPFLVRDNATFGVGQLPKFSEDLFKTTDNYWLISTGEVPLTNLVREQILDISELPLRFTSLTPCFRSEAGAAGRDTRGMIRMHQFYKVEIVSIVHPDNSDEEHERLTHCAEEILQKLNLPYRLMNLCAGDIGFSSKKTYDLEVWLPSQKNYKEISSCSNFGDFQARRMNARFKEKINKQNKYLHTLNGSGLAIGRTLVAILENYQDIDGSVIVPDILIPYMGGIKRISLHGN